MIKFYSDSGTLEFPEAELMQPVKCRHCRAPITSIYAPPLRQSDSLAAVLDQWSPDWRAHCGHPIGAISVQLGIPS